MNGLSKLQKILLWAGVALIVAALIGAPGIGTIAKCGR